MPLSPEDLWDAWGTAETIGQGYLRARDVSDRIAVGAERIGRGVKVFLKYDGLNPTGSFKDRGMTMAISKAKEAGSEAVICASTGNTSAAAAA